MYLNLIAWITGVAASVAATFYTLFLVRLFCYQDFVVYVAPAITRFLRSNH